MTTLLDLAKAYVSASTRHASAMESKERAIRMAESAMRDMNMAHLALVERFSDGTHSPIGVPLPDSGCNAVIALVRVSQATQQSRSKD